MRYTSTILLALLLATRANPARGEDPPPQKLEEAARQLGDSDNKVRASAEKTLRDAGAGAEQALRSVAESGDPEAARRAKALLRLIRQPGPIDPPDIEPSEVNTYRGADQETKLQWVNRGGFRPNVLVRLWAEEENADLRSAMFRSMLQAPGVYATAFVAHGNTPAAERLLDAALAQGNVQAAAPYAALCLLRGQLDQAITRWSAWKPKADVGNDAQPNNPNAELVAAAVLARLHRVAGNMPQALAAARRSGDPSLIEEVLLDARDWPAVADTVASRPGPISRPKQLGMAAGARLLARDDRGLADVIEQMRKVATPDTIDDVAHLLMMCGRVDDGVALLNDDRHAIERFRLLCTRERFDEAFKLVESKDAARDEPAMRLRIAAAEQLYWLGEDAKATALLDRVSKENDALSSVEIHCLLGEARRKTSEPAKAWDHFRTVIKSETARNPREAGRVAWRAFQLDSDGDGEAEVAGGELWTFLSQRFPAESIDQRFDRARSIVDRTIPLDELQKVVTLPNPGEGGNNAAARSRAYSSRLMRVVAERLRSSGQNAEAEKFLESAADAAAPEFAADLLIRLGDWSAEKKDWSKAANAYARAWYLDRTRPGPLYLRAWALNQAGFHARGGELTNLAHLLPLADVYKRYEVLTLSIRRRLPPEVQSREIAVVLRVGRPDVLPADLAQRLSAQQAVRDEDWLAAAAWQERSMLNYMGVFDLVDPVRYVHIPQAIRRQRARGLLAKGDVESAEREIAEAQSILPADISVAIDVVPEFEKRGNKARADELYDNAMRAATETLSKYPDSANHHNNAAWLAVNCGRNPAEAMKHAVRAVELRPKSAAYIDTLAEVQFRQGSIDEAIKTMKRCVELEPDTPRHQEQIERFEAAKRGEKRPMPPG